VSGGREVTAAEIVQKAERYREYFGKDGGITLSGGEPLWQPEFVTEVFARCKQAGIHTCLDTSGFALTQPMKEALALTDRVLLDIKYTNPQSYREYVGCEYQTVLDFLTYLDGQKIATTLRQVIIPDLNDTKEDMATLSALQRQYSCVDGLELLPFRKICQVKYDNMGMAFPFADRPTPTKEQMEQLNALL
jgi:pyruvate formate lyase activating enzyme